MQSPLVTYGALALAIGCEVFATTMLQLSEQCTKLVPTIFMALGYGAAFYLMSISLRTMPVGIVYAIWSGMGIVLISAIGYFVFKQALDVPAFIGLALIIAGVLIVNLFSKAVTH
ncbi:MAG TPA: multidrug efflux SMR transporter [Pirellulales bacterium]